MPAQVDVREPCIPSYLYEAHAAGRDYIFRRKHGKLIKMSVGGAFYFDLEYLVKDIFDGIMTDVKRDATVPNILIKGRQNSFYAVVDRAMFERNMFWIRKRVMDREVSNN